MKQGKRLLAWSLTLIMVLQSSVPAIAAETTAESLIYEEIQQETVDLYDEMQVELPADSLVEMLGMETAEATLIVRADKDDCVVGEKVTFQVELLEATLQTPTYTGTVFLNGQEACQIEQTEDAFSYTPEAEGQLMAMFAVTLDDGQTVTGFSQAVNVVAAEESVQLLDASVSGDFSYTALNGTYCQITGYSGTESELIIPESLEGLIVQSIADRVFENNSTLESVTLPKYLDTMGNRQFAGCTGLKTVVFNENLTAVGAYAFQGCSALESIVLPDSVKSIGEYAFDGCAALTEVAFPKELTTISHGAFRGCAGLTELSLPDGVTTMGRSVFENCSALQTVNYPLSWSNCESSNGYESGRGYIFAGCSALTEIEIPEGVTAIPDFAFRGCDKLEEVTLPSTLETIGCRAFFECTALKAITIPDSVTTIKEHAFYRCTGMNTVTFGKGLTTLENRAFYGCTGLTGLVLPDDLTTVGVESFQDCSGLKEITVGKNTKTIGQSAFEGCSGVTSMSLPESLATISHYAFRNCTAMESIVLPDSITSMGCSVFENCTALASVNYPISWNSCESSNGYESGRGYIFAGCSALTRIEIPEGVAAIPDFAFRGCNMLEEVILPSTLETIGCRAFFECTALKAIAIPDSVTTIKEHAFYCCTGLSTVTFGKGLTTLENRAFYGCTGLTSLVLPDDLTTMGVETFQNCSGLKEITVGKNTKTIGQRAFEGCSSLTSVSLPDGLTTISHYAFKDCGSLLTIVLPDTVVSIGNAAFENCSKLSSVNYPVSWSDCPSSNGYDSGRGYIFAGCSALTRIEIPEGVTAIPDFAFRGCNMLEEVILPSTLETIGCRAFFECTALKTITIPDSVTTIKEHAFYCCTGLSTVTFGKGLTTLENRAFYGCTGLTRLALPDELATVGVEAFQDCSGLREITVGKNTRTIGQRAFEGCSGVTSVSLPDGLTEISHYAFKGCSSLPAIVLPDTVVSIGSAAFENCSKLSSVNYPKSWGDCPSSNGYDSSRGYIFSGCTKLQEITIPEGVAAIPAYAFRGCSYLEEIKLPESVTEIGTCAFLDCGGLEKIWIDRNVTTIAGDALTGCSALTIHGYADSYAQTYAEEKDIPFSTEPLDLPAVGLSGKVQLKDGTAVEGVTVTLYDTAEKEVAFTLKTDASGAWGTEETLVGHSYRVYYYCPGYTFAQQNIAYTMGENAAVAQTAIAEKEMELPETAASDFTYTALNGAACQITGYTGTAAEVSVPAELDGLTVQSIAGSVFRDNTTLTSVVLPETIESVGTYLFAGCTSLKYVYLNPGLTTVNNYTFQGCTALESVALPGSVQTIGQGAFENCTMLKEVTLPEGLTKLSHYAFKGCTALETIVLPESIITTGRSVFENCTALASVNYPKNWTSCESANSYDSGRGYMFAGCGALTRIEIPEGVTAIPDFAFRGCSKLEEVVLPSTLETIGSHAFYECSALKSITIPDSIATIKNHAFYNCDDLTSVTVGKGLTSLGEYAFAENAVLAEITLPGTLETVPNCCFENSKGLVSVTLEQGTTTVNQYAFAGCTGLTSVSLPEGLTKISHYAFKNCTALESIVLPDSITTMGRSVFENCTALTSVNYPKSWISCESSNSYDSGRGYIFAGCSALTKIEIPEGVTAIPDFAFRGCGKLEEVVLPSTLETIGRYAFCECSALKSITIPDSVATIKEHAFYGCTGLSTVTFGKGLTTLENRAFYGCTGLTRLALPDELATVGVEAFQNCSGLREITVGKNTRTIGQRAFEGCSGVTSVSLSDGLTEISHYAFKDCSSLPVIVLPDTVTSIGCQAFANCSKLSSVNYPKSWNDCPSTNGYASGRGNIFAGCTKLQEITIPEGVTAIPAYAFRGCSYLEEIKLPESVTEIGTCAFLDCGGLEKIWIDRNVTTIAGDALTGCSALTIHGYADSYAQTYAEEKDIPFSTEPLDLPAVGLSGKVQLKDGTAVEGVTVTLYDTAEKEVAFTLKTDTAGAWGTEETLVGHTYRVYYYLAGYTFAVQNEEYTMGDAAQFAQNAVATKAIDLPAADASSFTYRTLNGAYCAITGYTGSAEAVMVPAELDGYIVQSIESSTFRNNTTLKAVALPDTVETVGSSLFAGCTNLKDVYLNHGLTTVSDSLFQGCTALESVALPGSVQTIGQGAFENCTMLKEVTLPEGLTKLSHYAFKGCTALETIVLPDSITTMGRSVFENCTALASVNYPKNWTSCESANSYDSGRGYMFAGCGALTRIEIPEGVTAIPDFAFRGCSKLEEVVLPSTLETIGSHAFYECSALKSITIPDSIATIKNHAFYNCDDLTSVTVGKGLTSLGEYAFAENAVLAEITLPGTLETVPNCCFENSKGLVSVTLEQGTTTVNQYAFAGCTGLTSVSLPEGLTKISHYAFKNCTALESIVLPDSITTMGRSVFENCTALTSVNYPKSWISCESSNSYDSGRGYIFAGCSALTKIEIPEGVTAIPDFAFRGCGKLEEVVLPSTLETIGRYAFCECSALKSITIPDSVATIKEHAFYGCTGLSTVTFGKGLTTLENRAFYGCTGLTRLALPDELATVGVEAFQDCSGLREITVGKNTRTIGQRAFEGCSGVTSVSLPDGLTEISHYAFKGCSSLPTIVLPDTVTSIGNAAFENCSKLSSVNYPLSWSDCPSSNGYASGRGNIFAGCTKLTEVEIPEGVTAIPAFAFRGCTSLETVVIPATVAVIGEQAFQGAGLTAISLPEKMTNIGSSAFADCTSLCSAYVPVKKEADVTVGENAFGGCGSQLVISCYNATNTYYYAEAAGITPFALDAHEHEMVEQEKHDPTCVEDGYINASCSVCGYLRRETIAALGHDFEEEVTIDKAPSCLGMGRQSRHCTRCIVTTDEQDLPATGHQFTGWVVTTAPTVMKEGVQNRVCNYCEHQEEKPVLKLVLTEDMAEMYGLVHFTVVHAQTLETVEGASISIETPEGEVTIFTDEQGRASHILPTGKHPAFVTAPGCKSRSLKINVKGGEQELPEIGVSERDPVQVELKHHYMSYDEILAAGIDPSAPGNSHVYRYELTITFRAELDLIGLSYMFNADGQLLRFPEITFPEPDDGNGGGDSRGGRFYIGEPDRSPREYGNGFSFWYTLFDGTEAQVHVTEKFLLIIYGEVKWLKEMFDVEMVILNTTGTDSIENAEAELIIPEGLSLATMRADLEQQTLRQTVPTIPAGETYTVHWYVRGDAEGSYDIAATLDGMLMPFEEEFHYRYEAEDPIKVYAGSAFLLTLEVPEVVYYGTNADICITLTNVSDRTMYNVSHVINNTVQKRLTYTTKDGETTVDEEIIGSSGGSQHYVVHEFNPGDRLVIEASIEICFDAKELKQRFKDLLEEMKSLSDSISAMTDIFDAFDTASDISGDLSDFMSDANKAVEAGKMSMDAIDAAESFGKLTDYMDFSKGEVENRDSTPSFFGMLSDLVDSLPIRYVLENVSVETMKDSTTEIPWRIVRVPGPEVNPLIPAGSISMPKLIYSIAILLIGRQDVKVGGMTLVRDYTNTAEAMEYVKYCWEQTAAIRAADPSGNATFRTYYVPAGSSVSLMDAEMPEDVTITVDNETARWENGVLTFTGEGLIQVTPHTMEGGTLYVQVNDEEPKAYVIEVVEPHECAGTEWVIEVPATEKTDGFRTKYCDVCGEICEVESLKSCGNHVFGDWKQEVAPTASSMGIDTRFCTKCCVMEYRLTDTLPFADVTELVTEASGKLVNRHGEQYLVLNPGAQPEEFRNTLTKPELAVRQTADGTALSNEALATGQTLQVPGVPGLLTLVLPGDVDGDGRVGEEDLNKILNMTLTGESDTDLALLAADQDNNGTVSLWEVADAMLLGQDLGNTETHQVMLAAYGEGGKLEKVVLPEKNEDFCGYQYLENTVWQQVKLFVVDGTMYKPLTDAICDRADNGEGK